MKAILVDDEPLALNHLAEEIERISEINIIGKFRNPKLALEMICRDCPQVVFLDIEMPEMSGIDLAERILQELPLTQIVFVTVYDDFAIRAFELNALDYILKPLHVDRLTLTIARLTQFVPFQMLSSSSIDSVIIHSFRSLQFGISGKDPVTLRWKTFKAQELFSYLLHHRGKPVRKQILLDLLWPDIDLKRGITQLYTAIYQVRKLLQAERINIQIANVDEGYMLELNGAQLDIEEWEKKIIGAPEITDDTLAQHHRIFSLYGGDYLAEYSYSWAETERRRLRDMWLRHARQIASYYTAENKDTEAAAHYLRVQSILPTEESIYFELMRLYNRLEDRSSVEKQYELLQNMLRTEVDMEPHYTVQKWFKDWKSNSSFHQHE